MVRWLVGLACVCLASSVCVGQNALWVKDGKLHYWGQAFEIWGVEMQDWPRLVTDADAIRTTFQVWSDRGINTVGYALQGPGPAGRFFAPDGQPADKERARQFTSMTRLVRDHHLASVVSLFSAERSHWLASAEAYRTAAKTAARLPDGKHSVVLIAGDLFSTEPWSPECPYPMGDPLQAIEICRVMKEARPDAMVGIPADVIGRAANSLSPNPGSRPAGSRAPTGLRTGPGHATARPVFYLAGDPEMLAALVTGSDGAIAKARAEHGLTTIDADHFFRFQDGSGPPEEAFARYLDEVERKRLAAVPPMPPTGGPMPGDPLTPEEKAQGWVPLFDGRTLTGWTTLGPDWGGWRVEDGALKCTGQGGRWLRTLKRYRSFTLRFAYRIVKNGNSGVFVWSPLEGRSSRFGMEMQIRGLQRPEVDTDTTGAIYAVLPPREDASKPPGEWNDVEIACRGSRVKITINGRLVQDIDADQIPQLKGRLRRGVIGLQDHGCEVWFRHIRIKEWDAE